jgi:guanosine-3',5'-bis(diphosphate) 3'-pyrophosphohydrolase
MRDIVHEAYLDAVQMHGTQTRKGSEVPYLIHVLGVAEQVALWDVPRASEPELWAAVMLHDTVEDGGNTVEAIEAKYGPKVAEWVKLLSFRDKLPDESSAAYQSAKEDHLTEFRSKPIEVVLIKLADRYRNVRDFQQNDRRYAAKYLGRAKGLTVLIAERDLEFIQRFGEHTHSRLREQFRLLATELL